MMDLSIFNHEKMTFHVHEFYYNNKLVKNKLINIKK